MGEWREGGLTGVLGTVFRSWAAKWKEQPECEGQAQEGGGLETLSPGPVTFQTWMRGPMDRLAEVRLTEDTKGKDKWKQLNGQVLHNRGGEAILNICHKIFSAVEKLRKPLRMPEQSTETEVDVLSHEINSVVQNSVSKAYWVHLVCVSLHLKNKTYTWNTHTPNQNVSALILSTSPLIFLTKSSKVFPH